MNTNTLLNSAAKWGVLIGVLMSASRIIEQQFIISGELSRFVLLAVEWLVAAVLFCSLLYRAIWDGRVFLTFDGRYSYGRGVNYAMLVSALSAVIVAVSSFVYVDIALGGYTEYIVRSIASLRSVVAQSDMDSQIVASYEDYFNEILAASKDVPSIFSALFSQMTVYIFSGGIVGVFASWVVARKCKQMDNINIDNEQ